MTFFSIAISFFQVRGPDSVLEALNSRFWCVCVSHPPCACRAQVMAIISTFKLNWPEQLLSVMQSLSFANLNLDLAQPECTVRVCRPRPAQRLLRHAGSCSRARAQVAGFAWMDKYYLLMAMPIVVSTIMSMPLIGTAAVSLSRRKCARASAAPAAADIAPPDSSLKSVLPAPTPGSGRVIYTPMGSPMVPRATGEWGRPFARRSAGQSLGKPS
jgi:hypothetical protein